MRKRFLALTVCGALIAGAMPSMAENEIKAAAVLENAEIVKAAEEKTEYTLSLEDAINMALKDNPQFISLDIKVKNAEAQENYARRDMKDMLDYKRPIKLPENLNMILVRRGYVYEGAKVATETAKLERTKAENALAYDITQKYFNVKLLERGVVSAKESYDLSLKNKQAMDTQFELGMVSELEKTEIDILTDEVKNAYETQVMNLELAMEALRIALQIENSNVSLKLTDDIDFTEFTGNIEEGIEDAINNRYDLYALKRNCDLSLLYRDIAKLCGETSSQYSDANNNVVQAEYTYTNTKKLIALSVRSSFNAIKNAQMNISVNEKRLELRKKQSEAARLKYELGMIGNTEYIQAVNNVYAQQTAYESALLTYKLAVEKYGYEISLGL